MPRAAAPLLRAAAPTSILYLHVDHPLPRSVWLGTPEPGPRGVRRGPRARAGRGPTGPGAEVVRSGPIDALLYRCPCRLARSVPWPDCPRPVRRPARATQWLVHHSLTRSPSHPTRPRGVWVWHRRPRLLPANPTPTSTPRAQAGAPSPPAGPPAAPSLGRLSARTPTSLPRRRW